MKHSPLSASVLIFFALVPSFSHADETEDANQPHIVRATLHVTAEALNLPSVETLDSC